jgi:hypothetical protein
MIIIQVPKAKARKRFDELCEVKNAGMPTILVTRTDKNGNQKEYERRTKAISDGAQNTGKAIILAYAYQFRLKYESMPEGWYDGQIPSLMTNSERIARFRQNITARSIRNHIKELKEIGLIKDYKYHGSCRDFELWLCPEILWGANASFSGVITEGAVNSTLQGVENGAITDPFKSLNDTNFPHIQAIETNGNLTTSIKKVENIGSRRIPEEGYNASKPQNLPFSHGNKGEEGAAAAAANVDKSKKPVDNCPKPVDNYVDKWKSGDEGKEYFRLHRYFQNAVMDFWKYAKESLWQGRQFTEFELNVTLDQIVVGYYQDFLSKRPAKNQFTEYQEELFRALDIAKKHYDRHPEQYPGDPYSLGAYPGGYFDARNRKGFGVSVNFRFKNKAQNNEDYGRRLIKTAMLHLANHPKGKAPKHLQIKTYSQVVDYYITKFKGFNTETQAIFLKRLKTLSYNI